MAVSRTWNLRLNLDEFNAMVSSLYIDADRALALQGMALGMNAGQRPEGVTQAFLRGWEFGSKSRHEAEEYRKGRAEIGSLGGRPQKPQGKPQGKPSGQPEGQPEGEPNPQSSILNPTTENDNPLPPAPQGGRRARVTFFPEMWDVVIPETWARSSEFVDAWHEWVADRKARNKPVTEIAARNQLLSLQRDAGSPSAAIEWIHSSIAQGYQGIFPPRGQGRPTSAPTRRFADQQYREINGGNHAPEPEPSIDYNHLFVDPS